MVTTRELYQYHPVYTYRDKEEDSGILIYPSYADTERDGEQPRFIVKAGSYNYSLMDTFYNNMSKEVFKEGIVVGHEHSQIIPMTLTILVHAYAEEESSDLADELAGLIVFACRKQYSGNGLVTRGVQVSETDIFNNDQKIYQTAISVSVDVSWTTSASKVDMIDDIITDIEIETEDPLYFDTYRPPGVYVSKDKKS